MQNVGNTNTTTLCPSNTCIRVTRHIRDQRMKTASQAQRGPRLPGSSASSASSGCSPHVVRPAGFELAGRSGARARQREREWEMDWEYLMLFVPPKRGWQGWSSFGYLFGTMGQ